ncbi:MULTISPECIES: hypothetical protein [Microvirga]|uniref:hypothetical protein n=1 Tax=Microvirga TaxID=186650 RepID=UPI0021C699B5|nr:MULTISPECIES: hypothetical protein [unclassified Microvirga]
MSVRLAGDAIVLEGPCRVEDAEPLLRWLQEKPGRVVDLTDAEHLHTAVFQVLLALRPTIRGEGKDTFVRDWMVPLLSAAQAPGAARTEG